MRRKINSVMLVLLDVVIVACVSYLAFFIRFEGKVGSSYRDLILSCLPLLLTIRIATFYLFGLYNRMWRYASISELLAITGAVTVSTVLIFVATLALKEPFPRSIYIISWFLNIIFIGASRMCIRVSAHFRSVVNEKQSRVLILGAGDTGYLLAREINMSQSQKELVGFIDDDENKRDQRLLGVKVLGNRRELSNIVDKYQIDEIIIAIPSLNDKQLREMIGDCHKTGCLVKVVPLLRELNGRPSLEKLRQVNLEDLLGREPVHLDSTLLAGYLRGKRVLVTGAGGSIGSELCRQIAKYHPETMVLLGKGENSIYEIEQELHNKFPELKLESVIADVRKRKRIRSIFARHRPQVVFHAAAHKHVPLMESQPEEAVENNIFGTKTVAEAARYFEVETFVMISTDKAINPTSVMGTTKRVAEQIVQGMNQISRTKFVVVRFGNVLGSRGSVVPLFQKQIAAGGPVTITDPEMKRYFMTIPEAVQLVLQAGSMARGGEVFVLDMGEPVKIYDMACTLIELAGLRPHKDIKIEFTGLRPGEKLFEELLTSEEGTTATTHEKIFRANLQAVDLKELLLKLRRFHHVKDSQEVRKILAAIVPSFSGYHPELDTVQLKEMKLAKVKRSEADKVAIGQ